MQDLRTTIRGKLVDKHPKKELRICIVKEAWRGLDTRPETVFYGRLGSIPEHERLGLPTMLAGCDVGEREVQAWEMALYGSSTTRHPDILVEYQRDQNRLTAKKSTTSYPRTAPRSLSGPKTYAGSSCDLPPHRPMHQTFTWRKMRREEYWYRDRSQIRFVVDVVGRPLFCFLSTKEMVTAVRDAIRGTISTLPVVVYPLTHRYSQHIVW